MATEKATLGAGCFWGVEENFRRLKGVTSTAVGYAGGNKDNPSYEDVCSDETGHAEVVQVEFDPAQISYQQLLDVFWSNHNPTTLNRQGPDVGRQYRSVIFYHSPEQKTAAEASKSKLAASGKFNRPIVTQIEPAPKFWRAEEYHQRYLEKRGQSHCAIRAHGRRSCSNEKLRRRRGQLHCRSCAQSAGGTERIPDCALRRKYAAAGLFRDRADGTRSSMGSDSDHIRRRALRSARRRTKQLSNGAREFVRTGKRSGKIDHADARRNRAACRGAAIPGRCRSFSAAARRRNLSP